MNFEIKTPREQHSELFRETSEACFLMGAVLKSSSLGVDQIPDDLRVQMVYFCEQTETLAEQILKTAGVE